MSSLTKLEIRNFLIEKPGYLKKSPIKTVQAMWKTSSKHVLPRNHKDLDKELKAVKEVQTDLRLAKTETISEREDALLKAYELILEKKNRPKKRLYFDIEVSPNLVFAWRAGFDQVIPPEAIVKERAIICICYKWEHEKEVHSLQWTKGDDKTMVQRFAKIIDSADEVVTQNGDAFDIKWFRTRCIYHGVMVSPKFNSIDTLKYAKSHFNFNSNKLDYMGQFLGMGRKIHTDFDLWRDITLKNCPKAMKKMVDYCKQDVNLLENVYHAMQTYVPVKKFKYNK